MPPAAQSRPAGSWPRFAGALVVLAIIAVGIPIGLIAASRIAPGLVAATARHRLLGRDPLVDLDATVLHRDRPRRPARPAVAGLAAVGRPAGVGGVVAGRVTPQARTRPHPPTGDVRRARRLDRRRAARVRIPDPEGRHRQPAGPASRSDRVRHPQHDSRRRRPASPVAAPTQAGLGGRATRRVDRDVRRAHPRRRQPLARGVGTQPRPPDGPGRHDVDRSLATERRLGTPTPRHHRADARTRRRPPSRCTSSPPTTRPSLPPNKQRTRRSPCTASSTATRCGTSSRTTTAGSTATSSTSWPTTTGSPTRRTSRSGPTSCCRRSAELDSTATRRRPGRRRPPSPSSGPVDRRLDTSCRATRCGTSSNTTTAASTPSWCGTIADYNGLADPNVILVGTAILLPPLAADGTLAPPIAPRPPRPLFRSRPRRPSAERRPRPRRPPPRPTSAPPPVARDVDAAGRSARPPFLRRSTSEPATTGVAVPSRRRGIGPSPRRGARGRRDARQRRRLTVRLRRPVAVVGSGLWLAADGRAGDHGPSAARPPLAGGRTG